jgi:hypothetical protein
VFEGLTTMARGVVVVCFSRFGKPLQMHHKVVLDAGAKAIAKINGMILEGVTIRNMTIAALSSS